MKHAPGKTWLGIVVATQGLTLLTLWGGPTGTPAVAQGIPDSGAQLQQLIEQAKATNAKLDRLITLLAGGKLEVSVKKSADPAQNR